MALTKAQKQKIVEELKDKIARQKAIILVGITGLKVKETSGLRKQLKGTGAELKVVKKNLANIVFKEKGLKFEKGNFKTEVGFVFDYNDEVSAAKTAYQFGKENENLKILGGFIENNFMGAEEIVALAQLPGREGLLAKLFFTIKSPIFTLNNILQQNLNILNPVSLCRK